MAVVNNKHSLWQFFSFIILTMRLHPPDTSPFSLFASSHICIHTYIRASMHIHINTVINYVYREGACFKSEKRRTLHDNKRPCKITRDSLYFLEDETRTFTTIWKLASLHNACKIRKIIIKLFFFFCDNSS